MVAGSDVRGRGYLIKMQAICARINLFVQETPVAEPPVQKKHIPKPFRPRKRPHCKSITKTDQKQTPGHDVHERRRQSCTKDPNLAQK